MSDFIELQDLAAKDKKAARSAQLDTFNKEMEVQAIEMGFMKAPQSNESVDAAPDTQVTPPVPDGAVASPGGAATPQDATKAPAVSSKDQVPVAPALRKREEPFKPIGRGAIDKEKALLEKPEQPPALNPEARQQAIKENEKTAVLLEFNKIREGAKIDPTDQTAIGDLKPDDVSIWGSTIAYFKENPVLRNLIGGPVLAPDMFLTAGKQALNLMNAASDAVLAPFAPDTTYQDTILENIFNIAGTSKDAFMSALNSETKRPEYASEIIKKQFPYMNPTNQAQAAFALSVVTDPLIVGSLIPGIIRGGLKAVAKGVTSKVGKDTGLFSQGLKEVLSLSKRKINPEELGQLGKLAQEADKAAALGDSKKATEAVKAFNDELAKTKLTKELEQHVETGEIETALNKFQKMIGDPAAPEYIIKGADNFEEAVTKSFSSYDTLPYQVQINLSKINSTEDGLNLIKNLTTEFEKVFLKASKGPQSHKITKLKSQNLQLKDFLGKSPKNLSEAEAYGLRNALAATMSQASRLGRIAGAAKAEGGGAIERLAYEKAVAVHLLVQEAATGAKSYAGRLLNSYKIVAEGGRRAEKQVKQLLLESGIDGNTKQLLERLLASTGDMRAASKTARKGLIVKSEEVLYEVFTNNILFNPITIGVNTSGNAGNVAWNLSRTLLEGMSAGARLDSAESLAKFGELYGKTAGIGRGFADIFQIIAKNSTWGGRKLPEEMLVMTEIAEQRMLKKITAENLGAGDYWAPAVDLLGKGIRTGGMVNLTIDRFFKILNYRMSVGGDAAYTAIKTEGSAADKQAVYQYMANNPSMKQIAKGVDRAEYYTFMNELGNFGKTMQSAAKLPWLRLKIPFFKTPTNLVKMGVRNSIVGNIFRDLKPALAKTGPEADTARANIMLGTAATLSILEFMPDDTVVTGSLEMSTPYGRFVRDVIGMGPYSIKLPGTNKVLDYSKIEPFRTVFGLFVNYRQAITNFDTKDPLRPGETSSASDIAATLLLAPLVKTISDVYMLQTVGQIVNLFKAVEANDGDSASRAWNDIISTSFTLRMAGSLNNSYRDPVYRQAGTALEQWQRKDSIFTAGTKSLPADVTLWGEDRIRPSFVGPDVASILYTRGREPDKIDLYIQDLKPTIPDNTPATVSFNGVMLDLTTANREKFARLYGAGLPGGPTLKDIIGELVNNRDFKNTTEDFQRQLVTLRFAQIYKETTKYLVSTSSELMTMYTNRLDAKQMKLYGELR